MDGHYVRQGFHFQLKDIFCETSLQNPRNNDVEIKVTLEDTKRASVLLIRKLFLLMQNLDVLPNNVYLTMKLYYYDNGKCVRPELE